MVDGARRLDRAACRIGGANQILRDAGLVLAKGDPVPSIPDCPNQNRIVAQEPAAGTTVEAGSTVTVFPGAVRGHEATSEPRGTVTRWRSTT